MKNKGISLIILIISMVVIVILAAIVIPDGIEKINNAHLAAFNSDIVNLKEELDGYMAINDLNYPVKVDDRGEYIVYSINNNPALIQQATKKGDQSDTFYILDLKKLRVANTNLGTGATIDDYFIIAKTSRNIYYAKGFTIDDKTYYTKTNSIDGIVAIVPTSGATATSTPTPMGTNTPVPTATNTPTPTNTPIPTATNTPTPTATNTPTPTATNTPTPKPTNTPTPTNTPVPTPTNTPVPTPTNTPTPTPKPTNTPTPTATNTPIPTATNTPMPTPTQPPLETQNLDISYPIVQWTSPTVSGMVRGKTNGSTIYIKCSYIDYWGDYYGYYPSVDTIATLTCSTLWQSFSGQTGVFSEFSTYYVNIWAEDSLGNRTEPKFYSVDVQ